MATIQTTEERDTRHALATPFDDTVRELAADDPQFRVELLIAATEAIVAGDLDETKAALRTYIKATRGYKHIADLIDVHPKSLIRMLGPEGNPRASTLVDLLSRVAEIENVRLEVSAHPLAA